MNIQYLDASTILDRFLERATQNLTIGKLLLQLHLDPNNITFEAIFHRLIEIMLVNINIPNMCALVGAGFYAATFLMRTMVPLRVFGIISALFFMAYGALGGAITTFLMYLLLLPINGVRLFQIVKLVKKARIAVQGDLAVDWLKPFMDKRTYRKGDILFRKGQVAKEMFLTTTGKYLVTEIGVELPPGRLVGELGFLTPNNKRTATVECLEDGAVLTISYDRLLEVYFGYPDFGYYFLRLASDRLLQNNARLEGIVEQYKVKLQAATAGASGVGSTLGETAPEATAPAHPVDSHSSDGKSEATMATETTRSEETGSEEPAKDASIVVTEEASPDAIGTPPDGRRASAVKLVERFSLWSGVAGLIPVPFVDLAAIGGVQIQMLRRISQIYSVPFAENRGKALIASLAGSMIPAASGIGAASIVKSVPVVGTAISAIAMPALSAGATYAIGMVFIQHFASGGTLLDFNPRDYREFIKAQKKVWSTRSGAARAAAKNAAPPLDAAPSTQSDGSQGAAKAGS
jgi:uncharacterized protein (DUF697 family)/CRP-like cAMP-binding protein